MEIDKNCTNTASVETSDQYINVNNKTDQKENNAAIRLPRKEFRKLMKKQRKKNARIEAAKAKQQGQEEEEETPEEVMETIKAEEKKRNAERILWEGTSAISPSVTSVQEDSSEKTDYGTEKDQVNCPFYLKTGACRYGDSCGRHHQYPEKSVTILVKNMYEGMPVQLADEDNDDNLEYDEVEAERHYFEFFEDVHTEFRQYGTIVQFKVCNNFQLHLRGNVYVQYSNEDEAKRAIENIRGRWYAGKQLLCEYCPVTKWKPAICGYYQRNQCPKGIQCNFLHVYKNPGGLYSDADRDFEDKRSDFIMAIENSSNITVSTAVNKSFPESTVNSTESSKRSRSSSSDRSDSHHSIVKRNSKNSRRKNRSKSRSRSHSRSPPLRSNDKYRYRHNYKRDNRYHNEHESRSHWNRHRGHWDRKPDYYDMNVDKKNKKDRNENDRKIQRRDSKRDNRKNSRTNKNENQSSDDSIVSSTYNIRENGKISDE
ncbi:10445_t:CDS:2 [Rhizophagus irregularis]|nr:10445_t:CDS:2 [Rhizophagus irregularis]